MTITVIISSQVNGISLLFSEISRVISLITLSNAVCNNHFSVPVSDSSPLQHLHRLFLPMLQFAFFKLETYLILMCNTHYTQHSCIIQNSLEIGNMPQKSSDIGQAS